MIKTEQHGAGSPSGGSAVLEFRELEFNAPELSFGNGTGDPPVDDGQDPFDDDFDYDPKMADKIDRWARPADQGGLGQASSIAATLCELLLESEPSRQAFMRRRVRPESITETFRGNIAVTFQWSLREGDPGWFAFEQKLRHELLHSSLWKELGIEQVNGLAWLDNEEFYEQAVYSVLHWGFACDKRQNGAFEAFMRSKDSALAADDLVCANAALEKQALQDGVSAETFERTKHLRLFSGATGKSYYSEHGADGNGAALSLQGELTYAFSYRDRELIQDPASKSLFLRSTPEQQYAALSFIETLLSEGHEDDIKGKLSADVQVCGRYYRGDYNSPPEYPEVDCISVFPERIKIIGTLYPQDFEDIPRLDELLESVPVEYLQSLVARVSDRVQPDNDYMGRVNFDYIVRPVSLDIDGPHVCIELAAEVDHGSIEYD